MKLLKSKPTNPNWRKWLTRQSENKKSLKSNLKRRFQRKIISQEKSPRVKLWRKKRKLKIKKA